MSAATVFRNGAAVAAGLAFNVVLTLATDLALSGAGVLPPFGTGYSNTGMLLMALSYRVLFAAAGGFLAGRVAPGAGTVALRWLMGLGLVLGIFSMAGGWEMFPAWYLAGIVALSLPATALGGRAAAANRANRQDALASPGTQRWQAAR